MNQDDSYVVGTSETTLLGETIGRNLDRTVERFPGNDEVVSVHQEMRLTYAEFHAAVEQTARVLMALGVEPRERVGIWAPNGMKRIILQ